MQPGACAVTASANRRPGCSSQLRAKCAKNGGCRVPQCTGRANRAPLSATARAALSGDRCPAEGPRSPPPDRHQGDIDRSACHGGERCHPRIQPRVTGDPDDARRAPDQLAVGVVGAVRHGTATMLGPHLANLDAAAYRSPAVPEGNCLKQLSATQPGDVRRGAHQGRPAQHAERAQFGVVVVEVGEEHHVRSAPRRRVRPRCQAPQQPGMRMKQRICQDPNAVDIQNHRGVTQPAEPHAGCNPFLTSGHVRRGPSP